MSFRAVLTYFPALAPDISFLTLVDVDALPCSWVMSQTAGAEINTPVTAGRVHTTLG